MRPERAALADGSGSWDNELPGTVAETVYVGDHLRVVVDVSAGSGFVIKMPNTAGALVPERGGTVRVGWRAEDCLALDA